MVALLLPSRLYAHAKLLLGIGIEMWMHVCVMLASTRPKTKQRACTNEQPLMICNSQCCDVLDLTRLECLWHTST